MLNFYFFNKQTEVVKENTRFISTCWQGNPILNLPYHTSFSPLHIYIGINSVESCKGK